MRLEWRIKTQRVKRGKMRVPESLAFGFTRFIPDWLRKRGVCADWLKYVARFLSPFLHLFLTDSFRDTLHLCAFAPLADWPLPFSPLSPPPIRHSA